MKFIKLPALAALCFLSACSDGQFFDTPSAPAQNLPLDLTYGWHPSMDDAAATPAGEVDALYAPAPKEKVKLSALLPLSGKYAASGVGVQRAMEIAALKSRDNVNIEFFDIAADRAGAIDDALAAEPDLILGPLFGEEILELKSKNTDKIPVISFTSDPDALGGGVYSLGLVPRQQAERIVRHIVSIGKRKLLIVAPNSKSGKMLASAAVAAADSAGLEIVGLKYHKENDSENLRNLAKSLSQYDARNLANDRAKEILADILAKEKLTASEKTALETELESRNNADTIGELPFDSVLILSAGNDIKSIASFLRYYDVPAASVPFFGTAAWDADGMRRDMILSGGMFPGLPAAMPEFLESYKDADGKLPYAASVAGYDAVMIASAAVNKGVPVDVALRSPDGWNGVNGIVRFNANGEAERGLVVYKMNGSQKMGIASRAPTDFIKPLYSVKPGDYKQAAEIELQETEIHPVMYINLPDRFFNHYFNVETKDAAPVAAPRVIAVDDAPAEIIVDEETEFAAPEKIEQNILENVEIIERPKAKPKAPAAPAAAKPAPKPAGDFEDVEPL